MDEVYRPLLLKLRVGSQSACAMAANLLEEELGKTKNNLCWHSTQRHWAQDSRWICMGHPDVWQAISTRQLAARQEWVIEWVSEIHVLLHDLSGILIYRIAFDRLQRGFGLSALWTISAGAWKNNKMTWVPSYMYLPITTKALIDNWADVLRG